VLLFYGFAWVVYFIGRMFDGAGSYRDVRRALSWGSMPLVWALIYRIPATFYLMRIGFDASARIRAGNHDVAISPALLQQGCGTLLLVTIAELVILTWLAVVWSRTLAEAHRFSPGMAFGTIVMACITPVIAMIAIVASVN
jgi:hypothetical protein